MKRAVILGVYAVIAIADTVLAQSSIHIKNEPMSLQTIRMPPVPTIGVVKPVERQHPETTIIIKYGRGGRMDEHTLRFADYRMTKAKVEVRGPCYSACTIVLAYVGPELLCVAPDGFMAFHAVRSMEDRKIMPLETQFLYSIYPQPVRDWLDRHGGWKKLPLDGFWTMYDRELWSMGYPRCSP